MKRNAHMPSGQNGIAQIIALLERTPSVLSIMPTGLPQELLHATEGPDTWSPHQVVGHLIHGEKTDWIARLEIILTHGESQPFTQFDRTGFLRDYSTQSIDELLALFTAMRKQSLEVLEGKNLTATDLTRTGTHPAFGSVTVAQLLSTWAVHDLGHIRQIVRVIAYQHGEAVGPWREYLTIVQKG